MFKVWTHIPFRPEALAPLLTLAEVVSAPAATAPGWLEQATTCDALIVGGLTVFDGPALDAIGARLRVVARTGVGIDAINLEACTARGVAVINTPDAPSESTAEHAIALLLALIKRVDSDRALHAGRGWYRPTIGLEARGLTLGLVGLGRIGGRVAQIAGVLGMRVIAHDPFADPQRAAALGVTLVPTLAELLGAADVVSLHCPALPETRHLINAATLAQFKPGSYLVNVARGAIIDEAALVEALRAGQLAGAGLDVFEQEPTPADNPLLSLPNTICTPHIASYTVSGERQMQIEACAQVAQALRGERPPFVCNPAVWATRR